MFEHILGYTAVNRPVCYAVTLGDSSHHHLYQNICIQNDSLFKIVLKLGLHWAG